MSIGSTSRRRTVVVKVGSAVLAPAGVLEATRIGRVARQIAGARELGARVVLVSSGAVAAGFRALGMAGAPASVVGKQAAAAVGQSRLVRAYAEALAPAVVAQVLLTAEDLRDRARFLNARRTLESLLDGGVVPIVNENDSVAYDEIRVGDNDRLSAHVAHLIDADLLVLLSVAEGLRADRGSGAVIPVVHDVAAARAHVGRDSSAVGTGGMHTKLDAAEIAGESGVEAVLASGDETDAVTRALRGEPVGTCFPVRAGAPDARKRWIGYAAEPTGGVHVDDGAVRALADRGASLLPTGVVRVVGVFARGEPIDVRSPDGSVLGRGLTSYASGEVDRIKGLRTDRIEQVLGYRYADEIVHRDHLYVFPGSKR